jgi:hypothetical protein
MGRVHFIGGSPRQLRCAPLPPITTGVRRYCPPLYLDFA